MLPRPVHGPSPKSARSGVGANSRENHATARRQPNRPPPNRRNDARADHWLTGLHSVREALLARRRRLDRLALRGGKPRAEIREVRMLAERAGISVEEVDVQTLDRLSETDSNHQGVALRVGPLPELSLAELVESTQASGEARRLLALDGVEDPQNVGALARVAESAGVSGMLLTDRRAPALTPSVARASAGAIEWLPVARVANLGRALGELQKHHFWVVAAAPGGEGSLFEMEDRILTGNLVVVLGAEGKGVRPSIAEQADHRVEIPMQGRIASLNVSTAGAVVLYDLLRRSESARSAGTPQRDGSED